MGVGSKREVRKQVVQRGCLLYILGKYNFPDEFISCVVERVCGKFVPTVDE